MGTPILNSESFRLRNGLHANRQLQHDFQELGEENFEFTVLDRLAARHGPDHDYSQELKEFEAMWLEKLQPYVPKGYHRMCR